MTGPRDPKKREKTLLTELDVRNKREKDSMCKGIAKFYIKIAHLSWIQYFSWENNDTQGLLILRQIFARETNRLAFETENLQKCTSGHAMSA